MPTKDEIGNKIRELRIKKGVSQEDLGSVLNKSHAAISDIERGIRNLTATELDSIARFFGVNTDVFFSKEPFSFTHYRDGKDMTQDEKRKSDKDMKGFFNHLDALIKKGQDKKDEKPK